MPCRKGRKTESTFHNVKRKTEQKEKKKKRIRTKTERKRKKTKKERREFKEHASIDRLLSLPLQNLTFLQKTQTRIFPLGQ